MRVALTRQGAHGRLWDLLPERDAQAEGFQAAFGDTLIEVLSDQAGFGTILKHTLGLDEISAAALKGSPGPHWTVRAVAARDYDEILQALRDASGAEAGGAALADYWRSDFVAQRICDSALLTAVHHRDPFDAITLFERDRMLITYIRPAGAPVFIPHLEHLVAYVLRFAAWRNGFVDVHAAFVRYRGKGVALIGRRKAGKTSLAMHLLRQGADLLGSDMAQIRVGDAGEIQVSAIPHMCRITRETVWDNALLATALGRTYDENRSYLAGPLFSHGKYELYDPSLARVFGRPVAIEAMRLDAIVFPRFDVDVPRQSVAPVPDAQAKERLMRSILTDRPLADWLPFDLSDRRRNETALAGRLADDDVRISAYDFAFGKEGSLAWSEIDTIFDRL